MQYRNTQTGASLALAVTLVLLAGASAAVAQYDLSWWTVDGGGAMFSTGGSFSLGGTIGQPDASLTPMTGGGFTLVGGFWAGIATPAASCIGDFDCNGQIDFADINPFVQYLSSFAAWQAAHPGCSPLNGDINGDGTYGQASFEDINPFVAILSSAPPPIACP
jgi:hypothetical protein